MAEPALSEAEGCLCGEKVFDVKIAAQLGLNFRTATIVATIPDSPTEPVRCDRCRDCTCTLPESLEEALDWTFPPGGLTEEQLFQEFLRLFPE